MRLVAVSDVQTAVGRGASQNLTVQAVDSAGQPVAGAQVAFEIAEGDAVASPERTMSDAQGDATTILQMADLDRAVIIASAAGVTSTVLFSVVSPPDRTVGIHFASRYPRILTGEDSISLVATGVDRFGNPTASSVQLRTADPTVLSVTSRGFLKPLARGRSAFVIGTADSATDSVLVTTLGPGAPLCAGLPPSIDLGPGESSQVVDADATCVGASSTGADYLLVAHFASPHRGAPIVTGVTATGISGSATNEALRPERTIVPAAPAAEPLPLETVLERHWRSTWAARVLRLRAAPRRVLTKPSTAALVQPALGSLVHLNASTERYCGLPTSTETREGRGYRVGRVEAVGSRAIVIADTSNPKSGFDSDNYRAFAATLDTLIDPVLRSAFGDPSDIDGNGRIILFFTGAVNQAAHGADDDAALLGFFDSRDLLPQHGAQPCPGSNAAELLYLRVPDPSGTLGSAITAETLSPVTNGIIAHEYQHLINASRRLYLSPQAAPAEETWLDEGLSHIAEELVFYRASGLAPRDNLDSTRLAPPNVAQAFRAYQATNMSHFADFITASLLSGPVGATPFDDSPQTRGATWAFLRYLADQRFAGDEQSLWSKLVDGRETGLNNLQAALGSDPLTLLRNWEISLYTDDVAATEAAYQEPSWNLPSTLRFAFPGASFRLNVAQLVDGTISRARQDGMTSSYFVFHVASGSEALLVATPSDRLQLTLIRLR